MFDVDHFIVQIHVRWKNVVDLQKNKFDSGTFPTVGFEPFVSIFSLMNCVIDSLITC